MRKLKPLIVVVAAFTGTLFAQSLVGTWQGTLKIPQAPNGELRTVIKISTTDEDSLKAVLYSIDQGGQGFNATSITRQGSTVKMSIAGIGGTYEGKLSSDGSSIAGTWTQAGPSRPLNLSRATPETAWTIQERMAANIDPGIEVATIKPSEPGKPGKSFTIIGQNIVTTNTTLSDLITMAYGLHATQIKGATTWVESDKYDLTVKPDVPGQPNEVQFRVIIQKLLADRFQLKFHREKEELSVYAITTIKAGAKIAKSQSDPNGLPQLFFRGAKPGTSLNVGNATINEVANVLQRSVLDKPVVDQTGLTEKYDFILKFTRDPSQIDGLGPPSAATDSLDAPPDIFTAFEQQLGLKLTSTKAPADVLVIDQVEKPSAN